MKRLFLLLFLLAAPLAVQAQDYDVPDVVISSEKASIAGKLYYLHKVLPKQTVFSICKAYGVTEEQLAASNPDLKEGLKAGAILFIPVAETNVQEEVKKEEKSQPAQEKKDYDRDRREVERVIEHQVRWYESLTSIARKYKISVAELAAYNGIDESSSIRGKTLLIPVIKEEAAEEEKDGKDENDTDPEKKSGDESEASVTPIRKVHWYSAAEPIHIALILPFETETKPSASFLNFYCGALMALQEQKEKGAHVVLNVYDLAKGSDAIVSDPKFLESDLVVGPVESASLAPFLTFSDLHGIPIVSPLDQKVDSLVDAHPFLFQVPASTATQIHNLVASLHGNSAGPVILVTSGTTGESAFIARIEEELHDASVSYRRVSLSELSQMAGSGSRREPLRVVIGSENRNFTAEVISTLNTLAKKNVPIQVWCTNRVRNYETSDPDALFNLGIHTSVPYFVDYSNTDDQQFVRQYRAFYATEPDDFAFQGHDVLSYFIGTMMQQGSAFSDHADLHPKQLLHCNFQFERSDAKSGWRNRATRNLVYDKEDYSISISK